MKKMTRRLNSVPVHEAEQAEVLIFFLLKKSEIQNCLGDYLHNLWAHNSGKIHVPTRSGNIRKGHKTLKTCTVFLKGSNF